MCLAATAGACAARSMGAADPDHRLHVWPVAGPSSSSSCFGGGGGAFITAPSSRISAASPRVAFMTAGKGGEYRHMHMHGDQFYRYHHPERGRMRGRIAIGRGGRACAAHTTCSMPGSGSTSLAEEQDANATRRAGIVGPSQHNQQNSCINLGELTEADRQGLLRGLLVDAHLLDDGSMVSSNGCQSPTLGRGFCNWVYKVPPASSLDGGGGDDDNLGNAVVVKVFSDLAKVRVPGDMLGSIDVLASDGRIGPKVIHRGSNGIVMEYVDGTVLTEESVHGVAAAKDDGGDEDTSMIHGDGRILCEKIGAKLAQLHCTTIPSDLPMANEVDNMLWTTLDAMLDFVGDDGPIPEAVLGGGWTHHRLCQEVQTMRQKLDALDLPRVLCHGDFKPSNIVVANNCAGGGGGVGEIVLIDYELSGPGYRGFDFYKLFRTADSSRQNDDNMAAFVRSYLRSTYRADNACSATIDSAQVAQVLAEMKLFEPLTWLEAGIFFLFAAKGDPTQVQRWEKLALDRFTQFDASKCRFEANLNQYIKAIR